ncbi:putative late blight resistance protein homolog R1B-14 [Salvia miltiorrhiza]|uniref:putative late blight resistance protein homolog R1B-14 n=1 Tax=Salvia miltiorrhiza TaxID=226208 RepID=UPI0025AC36A9|nr:putative late blight resistance protein homolog R1B-14 [Salvia miltiorrhiza]
MAAYAALMSLMHTIHHIQHHPLLPISLQKTQAQSLSENIAFLEEFLQGHNDDYKDEADGLERRIADAAYAAEDAIESHIEDQILAESMDNGKEISTVDLYERLQKSIEELDSIKEEAMEKKQRTRAPDQTTQRRSSSSSKAVDSNTLVGVDDVVYELMDKLTGGESRREVIPIVGMGGIGKTTLARNVYRNQTIVQHFDILVWVTISQEYNLKELLLELLQVEQGSLSKLTENELGEKLHKKLSSRRYLIVIDDIWDIKIWDKLKFYFPDYNDGSRILLTTRLSKLAFQVSDSQGIQVGFLDKHDSWNLFCKIVFGEEINCPHELERLGRKIVESCKGLPLSIDVIGGLLARSPRTQQFWKHIAENLSSVVNSDDDEHCLKVLYTSYNSLPLHLKPCFLYMSVAKEDREIAVSNFTKMWVAEGFLKPIGGKTSQEVAEECLEELVGRNLILVQERDFYGKLKLFKLHDLVRDLCLREAKRQKFGCRLSKVYSKEYSNSNLQHQTQDIFKRVNLRYIDVRRPGMIPSSISLLWYLQTVMVESGKNGVVPSEIWKMRQLKHVEIKPRLELPSPPVDEVVVLENLETLHTVHDFRCRGEVVERIPNIKKLRITYWEVSEDSLDEYSLNKIELLHKLSSLSVSNYVSRLSPVFSEMSLPQSVRKLSLRGTHLQWGVMTEMVGWLPWLQVLRLREYACVGSEWCTVEGQFCRLKLLEISEGEDLECWETESSHFPVLEHLRLGYMRRLKEIPSDIGDIPTLKSIQLDRFCSDAAFRSAKQIRVEQEELGNEDLRIQLPC